MVSWGILGLITGEYGIKNKSILIISYIGVQAAIRWKRKWFHLMMNNVNSSNAFFHDKFFNNNGKKDNKTIRNLHTNLIPYMVLSIY